MKTHWCQNMHASNFKMSLLINWISSCPVIIRSAISKVGSWWWKCQIVAATAHCRQALIKKPFLYGKHKNLRLDSDSRRQNKRLFPPAFVLQLRTWLFSKVSLYLGKDDRTDAWLVLLYQQFHDMTHLLLLCSYAPAQIEKNFMGLRRPIFGITLYYLLSGIQTEQSLCPHSFFLEIAAEKRAQKSHWTFPELRQQ